MAKSNNAANDELEMGSEEFFQYFGLAVVMLGFSMLIFWLARKAGVEDKNGQSAQEQPEGRHQRAGGGNRRQVVARNRRGRRVGNSDSEDNGDAGGEPAQYSDEELNEKLNDPKLGAKKRAKLEAKAEKRALREAEDRTREERKAKQATEQKDREMREQQDAEAEKRREEEEKRLREEKAQRELEEYLKMKEMFSVEEEGCEAPEDEDEGNLIEKFIAHIQAEKVILFEELATKFGLKVPEAIDRLTTLVKDGRLTGVMDDRGKFIYISEDELTKFAKFVKQRGRVSIADLVESSATLITLNSETKETV